MSPLELRGPEFLKLFLLFMAVAAAAAFLFRWWLRWPADVPVGKPPELGPYEVACLRGGARAAVDAAIAGLVHRKILTPRLSDRTLSVTKGLPTEAPALDNAVYHAARGGRSVRDVRSDAMAYGSVVFHGVESMGLVLSDGQAWTVRLTSAMTAALPLIIGLPKISTGLSRNRPVTFLVILCIITAIIALGFLMIRPLRTRRGTWMLSRLKKDHSALHVSARHGAEQLPYPDFTYAMALYGISILPADDSSDLRQVLREPSSISHGSSCSSCSSSASSCSSGSSCSGGSSCGGGGGCGGCGGGGD